MSCATSGAMNTSLLQLPSDALHWQEFIDRLQVWLATDRHRSINSRAPLGSPPRR